MTSSGRWYAIAMKDGAATQNILAACGAADGAARRFPAFNSVAVFLEPEQRRALDDLPAIACIVGAQGIKESADGGWYVNLLAAWEIALAHAAPYCGCVANMSLGPPRTEGNVFDPDEPMNRATRAATDLGIVVVVAAGNYGSADDTLTRWAKAPWVVAVGAADKSSKRVEDFSSRGVPGGPSPLVVAPSEDRLGQIGTSFAAPNVSDVVYILMQFGTEVLQPAQRGWVNQQTRSELAAFTRNALLEMARPTADPAHARGAGYVSPKDSIDFLRRTDVSKLAGLFTANASGLDKQAIREAQRKADTLAAMEHESIGRIVVDTGYHWSIPTFVPGLLNFDGLGFWPRATLIDRTRPVHVATMPSLPRTTVQIAITPEGGRTLFVGDGERYATVSEAVSDAKDWDTIRVRPGVYDESLELKSRVSVIGEPGAILRSTVGEPLLFNEVDTVTIAGLIVESAESRKAASILWGSRNVLFRDCVLRGQGNGLSILASSRVELRDCVVEGRINGIYAVSSRGLRVMSGCAVSALKMGLFNYGSSGRLFECSLSGDEVGFFYIPAKHAWTPKLLPTIQIEGSVAIQIASASVSPKTVGEENIAGELSRYYYAVVAEDAHIRGGNAAIAALSTDTLLTQNCTFEGKSVRVRSQISIPFDINGMSYSQAMQAVNDSLARLEFNV